MGYDPSIARYQEESQAILAQAVHAAQKMQHIDELLSWLAEAFIHHFDVQVAQFWSSQAGRPEPAQLRVLASKDASLPYTSVVNSQVIAVAVSHLQAQQNLNLQLVYRLLPTDSAKLLSQSQLNYCSGFFLGYDTFLFLSTTEQVVQRRPIVTALLLLLFFRLPSQHLPVISHIVKQIIPIAKQCDLLFLAPRGISSPTLQTVKQQPIKLNLAKLIPKQVEDLTGNPLGRGVSIRDNHAQRIYGVIDDRRNISQICTITRLSEQEVHVALKKLLTQCYIHVYEPGGKCVDGAI